MSNRSINAVTRKVVKTSEKEERVDVCNQLLLYKSIAPAFFGEGQVKVGVQQLNFSQFFITLSSSRVLYFQLFHREQFGVKL